MGAFTAGTCTVACTMHFGRRSTEDVPGMIRVVSWNLFKRRQPWRELAEMARKGNADIALLQEGGNLPADLAYPVRPENEEHWKRHLHDGRPVYDRWCLVVKLSEKIDVDWFRPVLPICEFGEHDIGVSGIGTIAAARVTPRGRPEEAFIAVSMYARWMKPDPSTHTPWRVKASDVSAHSIFPDLAAFIDNEDPPRREFSARAT